MGSTNSENNQIKVGVEELKIRLHSNVRPKTTYHLDTLEQNFKYNNIKLHNCSMNLNKRIQMTDHPVLKAYYTAFLEHYPVIVSPDILWVLILEGFSRHVRLNSEKLKNKFIKSGKDNIIITQEPNGDKNINKVSSKRWGDIFKDFVESSKEHIDPTVLHLFTPYFSTTTEEIEYACQLNIMSIIIPYVTFIKPFVGTNCCAGCAFPYIRLQGTLQDYKQLRIKIEGLKGFLIDDWVDKLLSIIDKIIETKKGNIDKKFWDNMITNKKREYSNELTKMVSDAHEAKRYEKIEIFGWIFDFFPFKNDTIIKPLNKDDIKRLKHTIKRYGYYKQPEYGEADSLVRNDIEIYDNSNFGILPGEMIDIDATYKNSKGQKAELGIKTGFLGYSLDEDHAFKPEIGWYFYVKNDPHNLIKLIKYK